MKLTKAEFDGLTTVEWAMKYFDGAGTGRNFRRRTALKLAEKGLIKSIGLCHQADGDGFVIESRVMRETWAMTDEGRAALAAARKDLGIDGYPV